MTMGKWDSTQADESRGFPLGGGEAPPTGAGNPKQENVGDSRSEHFQDGHDRAYQEFLNPGPDSENVTSLRSHVEDTRAGLKAAREFRATAGPVEPCPLCGTTGSCSHPAGG
jgi:hypothetical protein